MRKAAETELRTRAYPKRVWLNTTLPSAPACRAGAMPLVHVHILHVFPKLFYLEEVSQSEVGRLLPKQRDEGIQLHLFIVKLTLV